MDKSNDDRILAVILVAGESLDKSEKYTPGTKIAEHYISKSIAYSLLAIASRLQLGPPENKENDND